jgi:stalled ribosome alternative rescue factor ArfA
VTGVDGITPTGTLTYSLFTNGTCTSPASTTQEVTLAAGSVPNSSSTGALGAGSYAFQATYNGDANYGASTSSCEPFSVLASSSSTGTIVIDDATGNPPTGNEVTGSAFHDTASVTGVDGIIPTGTLTYSLFTNGTCTSPASTTQDVTLAAGSVSNSSSTGSLGAGSYSFEATYNGDANYKSSTSPCEPLTVLASSSSTGTIVIDNATGNPTTGNEVTGSAFHDTASVTGVDGITPTGTLTYSAFTNGTCSGPAIAIHSVGLLAGVVPPSGTTQPLGAGMYSFQATYKGDANYKSSTSPCEPLTVLASSSSTGTIVIDDATGNPPTGGEVTGSAFHDTATVTGVDGFTPTGTLTYSFFTDGTCTGAASTTQDATLAAGSVPNSSSTGALAPGSYAFQAIYNGDTNYKASTSPCEPFSVVASPSSTDTTVIDNATGKPPTGTEGTGSAFHDTATVVGVTGFTPTGTVTYSFFHNGNCRGTPITTQTVGLNPDGTVPDSNTTGALGADNYAFEANYSGNTDYDISTSACEPFSVGRGVSTTDTQVIDNATGLPPPNPPTEVIGSSFHDTATVTGVTGFTPTGTLTYNFWTNGACSLGPLTTQTVTLRTDGTVPDSASTGPLVAGSYSYQATYRGDANEGASSSSCEPFTVVTSPSSTGTTVIDDTTGNPPTGNEVTGSAFHDMATVTGVDGFAPTGTLTYSFFTDGTCTGAASTTQDVTLATGSVPNSSSTGALAPGGYSFQATYNGDANYLPATSPCEPFTVIPATPTMGTTVAVEPSGLPPTGSEGTGSAFHDAATVTGVTGFTPTGIVTYSFFDNGTCTGSPSTTLAVALIGGAAPNSSSTGALAAGSYSFQATYNGDTNYGTSTSGCELFIVIPATPTTATAVAVEPSGIPPNGTQVTGTPFHDTASVTGVDGFTPTGTLTYSFFTNGTCAGSPSTTQTVDVVGGSVPNSSSTGALAAGSYAFQATYNGDANYLAAASPCEPFTVVASPSSTGTTVVVEPSGLPPTGNEVTGSAFHDTASVTGVDGITPTGTLTYSLFTNGTCTSPASTTQDVTLAAGSVPNSSSTGSLGAGSYAFQATYNGDANYGASTSPCEPFTVVTSLSSTGTTVLVDATGSPPTGDEVTGSAFHDMATVTGVDGIAPRGTVTYSLFPLGDCGGLPSTTEDVTLAGGSVPDSNSTGPLAAGNYSFQATYNGDTNYRSSTSPCEPFSVGKTRSTTATQVIVDATGNPPTGSEATGSSFTDTATVTGVSGFTPIGSVIYDFFDNGTCGGSPVTTLAVSIQAKGVVPNSLSSGPLAAGSYSFEASYGGDANDGTSISVCEPFTVVASTSSAATQVIDDATGQPPTNPPTEVTGSIFHDTATVTGVSGFTPSGTLTYDFFNNGSCSETPANSQDVTLAADGSVPNSTATAPLTPGSYSFEATYHGDQGARPDPNYLPATSACEPFTVLLATPTVATQVVSDATGSPPTGSEVTGSAFHDTATVTGSGGIIPTGTVTYSFFANGLCNGDPATNPQTVSLAADGKVPPSSTTGRLTPGSYSFRADYGGGDNYASTTSACEPFTVNKVSPTVTTAVFDAASNMHWIGTETAGASAFDTATVSTVTGFTPTGTVTYTLFPNGACTGNAANTQTVTVTSGAVPPTSATGPLGAGSFSYHATYSGDANFAASTGACEPFTVGAGPPKPPPAPPPAPPTPVTSAPVPVTG